MTTQNLQEIQEAVARLLKYAVSDANKDIEQSLIDEAVPILQKDQSSLTVEEEAKLWQIYNKLSHLVAPANNESLKFKELMEREDREQVEKGNRPGFFYQLFSKSNTVSIAEEYRSTSVFFMFMGILCGILFFMLQSYTVTLADTLKQVELHYAELLKVEDQIEAVKKANPEMNPCVSPLKELTTKQDEFLLKIDGHYQMMQKMSLVWGRFYSADMLDYYRNRLPQCYRQSFQIPYSIMDLSTYSPELEQRARIERLTFFEGSKSTLRLSNYLILPLILGTLGSTAYVIRKLLDSFAEASLTFGPNRRGHVRVCLGALLGLISGVVIEPDMKEIQQISYSPLVWAFLMGYSVEFAFGFFDALIARGRIALQAIKSTNTSVKDDAEVKTRNIDMG
jgi:hypothetical protein